MTLRDILTCKETSQKLAEAGVEQEGGLRIGLNASGN